MPQLTDYEGEFMNGVDGSRLVGGGGLEFPKGKWAIKSRDP